MNRLSLGIQSFNAEDLKVLGRDHTGVEALKALSMAKEIFHKGRVTFDLIYARPGQTTKSKRNPNFSILIVVLTFNTLFRRLDTRVKGMSNSARNMYFSNYVQQALDLAGDHLSMYQLTVERSTP